MTDLIYALPWTGLIGATIGCSVEHSIQCRSLPLFKGRRVMLRQRLIGVTMLLLAVSMGTGCVLHYHLSKQSLERQLGRELLSVVVTLAPMIDGDSVLRVEKLDDGSVS